MASNSSSARCLPQGLPRTDINNYAPFKIIQTPGIIALSTRWTTRIGKSTRTAAPFTIKVTEPLLPDTDILESVCNENEKDQAHLDK